MEYEVELAERTINFLAHEFLREEKENPKGKDIDDFLYERRKNWISTKDYIILNEKIEQLRKENSKCI